MIAIRERHGKDADHRFAEPPWDEQTPRWQEIDQSLPADHLACQIHEAVAKLDLTAFFLTYSGRGSKARWPDLLLRLVLYEMQRGRLSPAEWFLDAKEDESAQWLLLGVKPSRTALYEFLDRLREILGMTGTSRCCVRRKQRDCRWNHRTPLCRPERAPPIASLPPLWGTTRSSAGRGKGAGLQLVDSVEKPENRANPNRAHANSRGSPLPKRRTDSERATAVVWP